MTRLRSSRRATVSACTPQRPQDSKGRLLARPLRGTGSPYGRPTRARTHSKAQKTRENPPRHAYLGEEVPKLVRGLGLVQVLHHVHGTGTWKTQQNTQPKKQLPITQSRVKKALRSVQHNAYGGHPYPLQRLANTKRTCAPSGPTHTHKHTQGSWRHGAHRHLQSDWPCNAPSRGRLPHEHTHRTRTHSVSGCRMNTHTGHAHTA
jgi:hypothetical protein